ncbi:MAG: glycoside hydrolase family 13, partial [Ferruginibacter sp.]
MKTKITFTLPAGNIIGAAECVLLGEFNNWNLDEGFYLQKQADGSMATEVELAAGKEYQYRYLLSNGRWVNDDGEKVVSEMSGYPVENCIIRIPGIIEKEKEQKSKSTKTAPKAKPVIIKDDLTKVEGIGKKMEALLYKNKIHSYKQLSKATIKTLKEILDAGG